MFHTELERTAATGALPTPLVRPSLFAEGKGPLRLRLYATLFLIDLAAILGGFALASLIRFGEVVSRPEASVVAAVYPLYAILAMHRGAYSVDALSMPRRGIARALGTLVVTGLLLVAIFFSLKSGPNHSRLVVVIGFLLSALLLSVVRWAVGVSAGRRAGWSFRNELVLVDGVPYFPRRGEVVLFAESLGFTPGDPHPAMLDRIGRMLRHCDRVVLACAPARRMMWSHLLKSFDLDAELLAPELDQIGALGMRGFADRSTLLLSTGPLALRARIVKRALDICVAGSAIALLAPLLLLVAAAIRIESPGPVLFRQQRVGLGNRIFELLKFRSMNVDDCDIGGGQSTRRGDSRITRVGRFIRSTSLDELPQLFNVLRGDMSIVGPRPHALESTAEDQLFWQLDTRYAHRHIVKPGMTGLAQVRGYRGATHRALDLTNRLQADLEYVAGWSIWRDLRLIAQTARVMLHPNAY